LFVSGCLFLVVCFWLFVSGCLFLVACFLLFTMNVQQCQLVEGGVYKKEMIKIFSN